MLEENGYTMGLPEAARRRGGILPDIITD